MRNANFVVFRKCLSGVLDAMKQNSIESSLYPVKDMNKLEEELRRSTITHFDYSGHIHAYPLFRSRRKLYIFFLYDQQKPENAPICL